MHRRRESSGLNWKPHLMPALDDAPFALVPFEDEAVASLEVVVDLGNSYAISVGTLSDVMPFPPGQL